MPSLGPRWQVTRTVWVLRCVVASGGAGECSIEMCWLRKSSEGGVSSAGLLIVACRSMCRGVWSMKGRAFASLAGVFDGVKDLKRGEELAGLG